MQTQSNKKGASNMPFAIISMVSLGMIGVFTSVRMLFEK